MKRNEFDEREESLFWPAVFVIALAALAIIGIAAGIMRILMARGGP